jgi:hypothetical protein
LGIYRGLFPVVCLRTNHLQSLTQPYYLDDATRRQLSRSFYNLRYSQAICPRHHATRSSLAQRNNVWYRWDRRFGNGVYNYAIGVCVIFGSLLSLITSSILVSLRPVCSLWEPEKSIAIPSIVLIGFSTKKGFCVFGLAQLLDLFGWWCVFELLVLSSHLKMIPNFQLSGGIVFTVYENIIKVIRGTEL